MQRLEIKPDETIKLNVPIAFGDKSIDTLTLRRPSAGELRGIKLLDLVQMEGGALIQVIPRICNEIPSEQVVSQLDTSDFARLANVIVGFFNASPTDVVTT